jgi:hypothetical protein
MRLPAKSNNSVRLSKYADTVEQAGYTRHTVLILAYPVLTSWVD